MKQKTLPWFVIEGWTKQESCDTDSVIQGSHMLDNNTSQNYKMEKENISLSLLHSTVSHSLGNLSKFIFIPQGFCLLKNVS